MKRMSMALLMGLALAGCGPSEDKANSPKGNAAGTGENSAPRKDLTTPGGPTDAGPGMGNPGDVPPKILKGMETPAYRDQAGSEAPGAAKKADDNKKDGDPAKPKDDKTAKD